MPVAVKLAPLLTAFAHFASQLDTAGADGLVLFTRFHRADIDVEELEVVRIAAAVGFLGAAAAPSRHGRAAPDASRRRSRSPAASTPALDVIKATMAGAHATQMVSALLRHGPDHLRTVRREIEAWMQEHEWTSLNEMRGNMSLERIPDPAAYERANFRMALR